MGAPIFFRIEDLNARANLCEIGFKPASIKIPMEPLQREKVVRQEWNQQLHKRTT